MDNPICNQFDRLVGNYYQAWFRFHPELAVDAGVEGYEAQLTPYNDDDIGALISLIEKLLSALDEINFDQLSEARQINYRVLRGSARIEHHELLEQDWRRRDPSGFLPVNAIYQLTIKPIGDFEAALVGRLEAIPGYLRGARAHLQSLPALIPPPWLEATLVEAESGAHYLRGLLNHPKVKNETTDLDRVRTLLDQASKALEDYHHFLTELQPLASGSFASGREHFDRLLNERHFLEINADQLHEFGSQLFDRTAKELESVAQELGSDNAGELISRLKNNCPSADELLDEYRAQMKAAKKFLQDNDLVTLPSVTNLKVIETPMFLRHQIPFAAYQEPSLNDPEQTGYYYVTPPTDDQELAEHHRAGIGHTCVHEAWPGHHLQFVTANLGAESSSLPRLMNPSATLYEGWALYCEQLMQEQGFLDIPEQRFILLRDRLWRALRIILDVEIHTRGLTLDEAADKMEAELGFPRSQALADLSWYCRAPGVPMGYATGWVLIRTARNYLQEQGEFELKAFHDGLLAQGSIAVSLVLESLLGEDLWPVIRKLVFLKN